MPKRKALPIEVPPVQPAIWRNRIVRYGDAAPGELVANEKNWRTHPKAQHEALAGALGKVGIVQNVVVNERSGKIIDGHLRVDGIYGGYSVGQMRQKMRDFRLLELAENPSRLKGYTHVRKVIWSFPESEVRNSYGGFPGNA